MKKKPLSVYKVTNTDNESMIVVARETDHVTTAARSVEWEGMNVWAWRNEMLTVVDLGPVDFPFDESLPQNRVPKVTSIQGVPLGAWRVVGLASSAEQVHVARHIDGQR